MPRLSTAAPGLLLASVLLSGPARAQQPPEAPPTPELDLGAGITRTETPPAGKYVHGFGALALGKGLRLNNPYRLRSVLGDDAESLSASATYLDVALGAALGHPRGLQHGGVLHLSIATDGITQEVISASYQALRPLGARWLLLARAGVPIVLEPDLNAGFELAAGGAWLIGAAVGLGAELACSLFYGAATLDRSASVIPIVSLQGGLWFDYEVLP